MRKLMLSLLLITATAFTFAQTTLGFKLNLKTGLTTPTASYTVKTFDTFLNWKLHTEIIGYAGSTIENGKILGGGAWVVTFPLAKGTETMEGYLGLGAEFLQGSPTNFGLSFGVRFFVAK